MSKLYKSSTDRKWLGVAGGLGEYLGIDPTLIRLIFLVATFAGVSAGFWIYVILAILLPYDYEVDAGKKRQDPFSSWGGRPNQQNTNQTRRKDVTPPEEKQNTEDDWSNF